MVRSLAVAVILAATLVPASIALADPGDISKPADVLQGADRIGNLSESVPPPPPPPPPPPSPPPGPQVSSEMQAVLEVVNAERTSRGLVPVRFSAELNDAALDHTRRQANAGDIFHIDPGTGTNPGQRITAARYDFSTWGENVAAGQTSPAAVMTAWMTSPGHCRNILNPAFTEIGVGFVAGGQKYGQFWTQKFARPKGDPKPPGTYNAAWC